MKQAENAVSYMFRRVWREAEGCRRQMLIYVSMLLVAQTLSLTCRPYLMGRVTNVLVEHRPGWLREAFLVFSGLVLYEAVFWLFHGPARILERRTAYEVWLRYKSRMMKGVLTMPLKWHSEKDTGDIIDKIMKGSDAIHDFTQDSFEIIYPLYSFPVSFCFIAGYHGVSGVVVAFTALVLVLLIRSFDAKLLPLMEKMNEMENRIVAQVADTITNIVTVITLRVEDSFYDSLTESFEAPRSVAYREHVLNELKWFSSSMCCSVMASFAAFAYCAGHSYYGTAPTVADFVILWEYLRRMGDNFTSFTSHYNGMLKKQSKLISAEKLAREFVEGSLTNHVLIEDWQHLEVTDLNFAYDSGREHGRLLDINIALNRGEHLAIIGRSGSGKSTLLKILAGLVDPESLILKVNGSVVPEGIGGIYRAITSIPQETEIFRGTVAYNLTFNKHRPEEVVAKALEIAGFTPALAKLPRGLASEVYEKGVNLSGGEKQRLALARGFLADVIEFRAPHFSAS